MPEMVGWQCNLILDNTTATRYNYHSQQHRNNIMSTPAEFPNVTASEDEVRDYLNDLRDSGDTNMFGAGPYLERDLDMSRTEARASLMWWMGQY